MSKNGGIIADKERRDNEYSRLLYNLRERKLACYCNKSGRNQFSMNDWHPDDILDAIKKVSSSFGAGLTKSLMFNYKFGYDLTEPGNYQQQPAPALRFIFKKREWRKSACANFSRASRPS